MKSSLACLGLALALAAPARAQSPDDPIKLTLTPAAAPAPLLKYRLLPELADTQPGNAALLYQRAHSFEWWTNIRQQRYYADISDWLDLPFKKLPPEAEFVRQFSALREVDLAARREHCDWEMTSRLKQDGIGTLIPDVQGFREYAVLLGLRCRFEIADKDYPKAVYTLQSGFALARHVNEAPILINSLVGMAISDVMFRRVEEMIQAPGAPNLYWALTALPRPLIDLRKGLEGEKMMLETEFPELKIIETEPLSPHAQQKLLKRLADRGWLALLGHDPESGWQQKFGFLSIALKAYPQAKRSLIAQGHTPAEVEAMPVMQVVLIDALRHYRVVRDQTFVWANLPYWQAQAGWKKADNDMRGLVKKQPAASLFVAFLPAVHRVFAASARLDRRIAALRCIEAIRLHAAAHGGQLPAKLADITVVPVPDDPATGKSFVYRVDGNRVTLRDPPLADGQPGLPTPLHYELTFKR